MSGLKTGKRPNDLKEKLLCSRMLHVVWVIVYWGGCLFGILSGQMRFLELYADALLPLITKTDYLHYFAVIFLPQFVMFTALFFFGSSAVGFPFIPLLFLIKGYNFGTLSAALYGCNRLRGLVHVWAFFWLPETVCVCLMLYHAGICRSSSRAIAQASFYRRNVQAACFSVKSALSSYIFVSAVAAFACLISSLLQVAIVRLFFL